MEPLREKIILETDASGIKGNSLSALITQLEQVEAHIQKVNAAMSGMKAGGGAARSVKELEAEIQRLQGKLGTSLKAGDLSKSLGLDQAEFERFLARQKSNLKDYQNTLGQFRSTPAAARAVARFEREGAAGRARLGDLLRPAVSSVHPTAASYGATTSGKVLLEIPGAQVQASVAGLVQLNIPANQIQGLGSAGRDAETGLFTGGGGKKKKGAKAPLDIPRGGNELQRVRVDTEKYLRDTITAVDEAGSIVTTVHDSVEGILKTSRKTVTGARPIEQFREARRLAEENFKQLKAAIDPKDPGFGLAALQQKQGQQLSALTRLPFMQQIAAPKRAAITQLVEEQSLTLEARSIETFKAAQAASSNLYYRGLFQRFTNQVTPSKGMTPQQRASYQAFANQTFGGGANPGQGMRGYGLAALAQRLGTQPVTPAMPGFMQQPGFGGYTGPVPPKIKPPPTPPPSPFARGLKSFTPVGFAANLLNVTGWAAAVTTLFKATELATYSMGRLLDIGQQTARLGLVFRGVGGTAQQLTGDILQLAAANGRDTEEAMASATQWARLGLSRVQVNEAVRVSLEAANISGLHASETTEQLASIYHIFNLQVKDLAGTLGMLQNVAQNNNSTLEDLFQGLDRSAGSAKLAKVGLAELAGQISTIVGRSGASGSVVGNTLTWIYSKFNEPIIQEQLKKFGIETLDPKLGKKSGSEIIREMAVKWQGMNPREQQDLTRTLVGSRQSTRFQPLMNNFLETQKLAIDAQLHLNAAEEANVRILGTMKSQLAGVRSEWDRLVVNKGGAPGLLTGGDSITGRLTVYATAAKNALRVLNGDKPGWALMGEKEGGGYRWVGNVFRDLMQAQQSASQETFLPGPTDVLAHLFTSSRVVSDQEEFARKQQELTSRAGGLQMRGRMLETIGEMLPGATGDKRQQMIQYAAEQMGATGENYKNLMTHGDEAGGKKLLDAAARKAREAAVKAAGDAVTAQSANVSHLELSKQNIDAEVLALQGKAGAQKELNQKLQEQQEIVTALEAAKKDASSANDDYAREKAGLEDVIELQQQYLNALRETQAVQEAISSLASQSPLPTAGGRLDAQIGSLDVSLSEMKKMKAVFEAREIESGSLEDRNSANQMRQQIRDMEAQRAALDSPQVREVTRTFDNRQLAAGRARAESESYAVGYTESEKLLNQQRSLRNAIGKTIDTTERTKAQPYGSENDRIKIKELEIALWQNQEKIQMRIVDLARQEKQIRIDATREWNKNLLLAGPGEQMQRLYVSSLASRKIGSGEFNALSPELKRMFYELQGGTEGAKMREEQNLLRGRHLTVEQEQAAQERAREQTTFSGQALDRNLSGRLSKLPAMPLPPLDPMVASARVATEQLGILGNSATRAAKALDQVPAAIDRLVGGAMTSSVTKRNAPPPKLDIQPGYSIGAMTEGDD